MAEDELIESMREKFRAYYEYQLVPVLERLEELRKKYKLVQWLMFIPLAALLVIAMFFCYTKVVAHYEEGRDLLLFVGLGFAAVGGFLLSLPAMRYQRSPELKDARREIKNISRLFMEDILSAYGDFNYAVDERARMDVYNKIAADSKLFPLFVPVVADDAFCGNYGGNRIEAVEVQLKYSGKKDRNSSILGENAIQAVKTFGKNFDGQGVLLISYTRTKKINGRVMMLSKFSPLYGRAVLPAQAVNLEHSAFGRYWTVRADDQIEARYLLTPAFMEKLMAVKRLFAKMPKGDEHFALLKNSADICFADDKMYMAIWLESDWFDFVKDTSFATALAQVDTVCRQLQSIFDVIDFMEKTAAEQEEKTAAETAETAEEETGGFYSYAR